MLARFKVALAISNVSPLPIWYLALFVYYSPPVYPYIRICPSQSRAMRQNTNIPTNHTELKTLCLIIGICIQSQ